MAGAVVQPPASGQPVGLKSALKKGSTRRKRQVVIDEARNTYCEATTYYEDVPLPRRRDLALKKAAQQKAAVDATSTAMMTALMPPTEPQSTAALNGRRDDETTQRTSADTAPPADGEGTTGSDSDQKRVPSPQTLVTALLTDSLKALTTSGPREDNHQFWRHNLPDLVTESVEGDSGRSDDSPTKPPEPRSSPPAEDGTAEETAHTFRVIKEDGSSTDSENSSPEQGRRSGPAAPVATSVPANKGLTVSVSEPVSPKFSEIVLERPISVLINDNETDSDAVDSPRKPSKPNPQATTNDRVSGLQISADSFVKSPLGLLNTSGNSVSDPSEPGSPSSDTDLSALSHSSDRFWKLSSSTRSDFPASPATSSGSSASSSPPAWDRSPSGSPPRRSPPSVGPPEPSPGVQRDSPSPPDSPAPVSGDDGYSLDDIEDALRDEPPSPVVKAAPISTGPPNGAAQTSGPAPSNGPAPLSGPTPLSGPALTAVQEEPRAREEQPARQEERASSKVGCPEEELAGFVEGQAARTERLRRRYAAAEDGGFIRRPSVRGVVIQQPPTGHYHQQQEQINRQQFQQQQQLQQQLQQQQQQQQPAYWQRPDQLQPQQRPQQPLPPSSQHSQLHRQHSAPLQPRPAQPVQMAPQSGSHLRQQSAPHLPRADPAPHHQRTAPAQGEYPQRHEQMYVTVRPADMQSERLAQGQPPRQMAPPQQGRQYQPAPPQMQQYSAQIMQQQPVPMQQRSAPVQQYPGPMPQQQSGQGRPQDPGQLRSAQIPVMHAYQTAVPNHNQSSMPTQSRSGFQNPATQLPPPHHQQQYQHPQQHPQQPSQHPQYQPQHPQQQHPPPPQQSQQSQQQQPRPLPMGQTRQQQLEQIRRLQDAHMVRVPAVTVGFPDESSRRQVSHWNAPAWLPSGGGGGARGSRERESFRTSRQRSASQQRLEAVGRPASLALPRAYEWPQDRAAPPPPPPQPPQPPARFCEPSVTAPPAAAGAGAVTLPRRLAAQPEVTGSLPRHQRLGSNLSQASVTGWPAEGGTDPRISGPQPAYPPSSYQHHGGWPAQPAPPGAARWYEPSAAQQMTSVTSRGAGPSARPLARPAEPLYVQRLQPSVYGDDLHEMSADEHDV
ncbi:nascent polypeptide-associated complex subunit alpha, muscle-specific form-like [Amphibalanus amphitrite]|uniref:nascent polypeptide-associated complex subunit alpha, muscle-specific form-like n=1 Tax=Amphibalanus amphitrite TaxID=1232801 RepID=UPI001C90FF36|nr:nascent polypeptide-associated complex subunit alpha, muscle-specific form-like [Amphibalanus amphitrite]